MSNINIPLVNKTGLTNSDYTIYVMGFSPTSKKYLFQQGTSKTAAFADIPTASGSMPAYKLGTDINQISVDKTPSTTDPTVPASPVDGARIYFFIAENSVFPSAPVITYSNWGADVQNVKNPPNPDVPPYTFAEFTLVSLTYGAVIDSQTVDGFVFPVTINLNNGLGQIGQPLTVNRASILAAYLPFMSSIGSSGTAFNDLSYTLNKGGLLNPGAYLNEMSDTGEFSNLDSPLNSLFDADLNSFFSNNSLSIQGVSNGTIPADIYTAVSGKQKLPGSTFSHQALQFTGTSNGQTFNIYNPVGLCVLTTSSNGVNSAITGTISGSTLTFASPLPASTPLVQGMFVQGAGVPANITIRSIALNAQKEITSVNLGSDLGKPAPDSQYRFSKLSNMFLTSGTMVFGNQGVFAYSDGVTGDGSAVILNLQNQIVTAFNRGVANLAPTSGSPGYTTEYWGTQTNWYPANSVQNLFSLFMHTGTTNDKTPIFLQASNSVACARGTKMAQSYGFAYDENAGPVPPSPKGQPEVPSKYDPLPAGTTAITITLGPWSS